MDEYREHIEKDGALERRFQKVHVDATSIEDTIKIMNRAKENYEKHHKVHFTDEVIKTCVMLADRYITDREFPDKAIDIMDEVGARCQINVTVPEIIEKLKEEANQIKDRKVEVVRSQKYEEAAELRDIERKVLARLQEEKDKFEKDRLTNKKEVTEEMVYEVVSQMTKIPISKLSQSESDSLINLEESLTKAVIGQEDAVSKIAKAIRRNRVGIKDPNKPIGSFIFLGSTGIGKTHLAKQLAKEIFGNSDALIRVDMSEYQEKFTMTRLVGSPPGYVGHQEGGQLTEQVKNKPYCVILFDEIDTGVSGDVAEKIGKLLKEMGQGRQLFAITHLPQVAAQAQHHLVVRKTEINQRIETSVTVLGHEERITEIARLMSGETINEAALVNASTLLNSNEV